MFATLSDEISKALDLSPASADLKAPHAPGKRKILRNEDAKKKMEEKAKPAPFAKSAKGCGTRVLLSN